MTLLAKLRARRLRDAVKQRRAAYDAAQAWSGDQVAAWQLQQFNERWRDMRVHIPFYRDLDAPDEFDDWPQFLRVAPLSTRADIRDSIDSRTDPRRPAEYERITGGSTAEPVRLPAWRSEDALTLPDMWMGRSWYGLDPADPLFLLWGHSHLLGDGLKGRINARVRQAKDRALGYTRFSAYDLTPDRLRDAADLMMQRQPRYVIGYSGALDQFARANHDRADQLRTLKLNAVIATAERFPALDSAQRLEHLFGCPVAMEYGAVETHLLGHTHPDGGYHAFWKSLFIEACDIGPAGGRIVRVTTLYPRCFPLVRYELGDELELYPEDDGVGVRRFLSVTGRCNDLITLTDGSTIHSEMFTHCLKSSAGIERFQVVQSGDSIRLDLVLIDQASPETIEQEIRTRLVKANPALKTTVIRVVDQLAQSRAGKTPMVIRESETVEA